jgi:enterochelin esterase-like enzyme
MNIAKIKEALADAKREKRYAEANGGFDYAYWSGYEDGVLMALFHAEEKSK